jgi:predicted GH43/DUF377 family glycosyl hydrolase
MPDEQSQSWPPEAKPACVDPARSGWPIRFDENTLWPDAPGRRLNPSILADGDGYLFCVRASWRRSNICIGRLDADFRPVGRPTQLTLEHPDAPSGREDPRLFRHKGQPHVAFTGMLMGRPTLAMSQLCARLSADGMRVEGLFAPHYPPRRAWEKNWSFFDHRDDLYAVYSFTPCRILKIEGDVAIPAYETPTASPWRGGDIRGGAAPVRVGDELWCFTHDRISDGRHWIYRTALVTLTGDPPFRVLRMLAAPILVADRETKPANYHASVVFAGGAVRRGDDWIVAHGIHDHWSELHLFSHAELESRLVTLPRGPTLPGFGC